MRPSKIYLACDGSKIGDPENERLVAAVRELLDSGIDWKCELHKRYLPSNQGCKDGVSGAIDWFFTHEECGIIIEDDVVCDPSFFVFASQLLKYYRNDPQVGAITANSFTAEHGIVSKNSYVFTAIPHIWGWATWRRTWSLYDPSLSKFQIVSDFVSILKKFGLRFSVFWVYIFYAVRSGKIDTWDYQLTYTFLANDLVCIMPTVELADNIGYDIYASHTSSGKSPLSEASSISFPLCHPDSVETDIVFEKEKFRSNFLPKDLHLKFLRLLWADQ